MQQQEIPSFKDNLRLLGLQVWNGLAHFFECDQSFRQLQIVPHQIHFIKDNHTLLTSPPLNSQSISKQIQDDMLLEHNEAGRWAELLTWKWWKLLICCHSEQNNWLEENTHYDSFQYKPEEDEKDQKLFSNHTIQQYTEKEDSKASSKENVVYVDDQMFQNQKKNPESAFSELNNDSVLELKPIAQKVNIRNSLGNIGLKRRNRMKNNLDADMHQNDSNINAQNQRQFLQNKATQQINHLQKYNPNLQHSIPEPVLIYDPENDCQKQKQKQVGKPNQLHSSQKRQQQSQSFQRPVPPIIQTSSNQRKQSEDIVYHQSPNISYQKYNAKPQQSNSILNSKEEFSQLQANLQKTQQKYNFNSQTPFNQLENISVSINNYPQSSISQQTNQLLNNMTEDNQQGYYLQKSESYAEDGMRKRKKKARNLFQQQITAAQDLQVIQQQPPEDMEKRKRKRRKRGVLNEQKQQQQRAMKRKQQEKQQLEVIIYSDNENNE